MFHKLNKSKNCAYYTINLYNIKIYLIFLIQNLILVLIERYSVVLRHANRLLIDFFNL